MTLNLLLIASDVSLDDTCDSSYQSHDRSISCSIFSDIDNNEKCFAKAICPPFPIPCFRKAQCESFLLFMYRLTSSEFISDMTSKLFGCKCVSETWISLKAQDMYDASVIMTDEDFFEGPLVVGDDFYWAAHKSGIMRRDSTGNISVYVKATCDFIPHGLAWDPHTETIVVASNENTGKGGIFRVEVDSMQPILTKITDGVIYNSPNDLIVRSDGVIYFTDPIFYSEGRAMNNSMGLYSIIDGVIKMEYDFLSQSRLSQPNGLALNEDESGLYVALTSIPEIVNFTVAQNGSLSYIGKVADGSQEDYSPDGLVIHNQILHIATNKDYILRVGLNDGVPLAPIWLFNTNIFRITNLDINATDGSLYITDQYLDSIHQVVRLRPKI